MKVDEELNDIVIKTTALVDSKLPIMKTFMKQKMMPDAGVECPDEKSVSEAAREVGLKVQQFKEFLDKLEGSKDFQVLERFQEQELLALNRKGMSYRNWERATRWTVENVEAMIAGRPMPPQPPGLVLPKNSLQGRPKSMPDDSTSKPKPSEVSALPFTEADFDAVPGEEAKALKDDFLKLVQDHKQTLQLGHSYGDFDPSGKQYFLSQMMQIAWRWEDLIEEAQDADIAVDQVYAEKSKRRKRNWGYSAHDYKKLVEDVNTLFRTQSERDQFIALGK